MAARRLFTIPSFLPFLSCLSSRVFPTLTLYLNLGQDLLSASSCSPASVHCLGSVFYIDSDWVIGFAYFYPRWDFHFFFILLLFWGGERTETSPLYCVKTRSCTFFFSFKYFSKFLPANKSLLQSNI